MPEPIGRDIRDRIDDVNERVIKAEGRQEGHELLCAQRYSAILEKISEIKESINSVIRVGMAVALMLLSIEFGRSTFPALFDFMTKGH